MFVLADEEGTFADQGKRLGRFKEAELDLTCRTVGADEEELVGPRNMVESRCEACALRQLRVDELRSSGRPCPRGELLPERFGRFPASVGALLQLSSEVETDLLPGSRPPRCARHNVRRFADVGELEDVLPAEACL